MKKISILTAILCLFMSLTCMAQKKPKTPKKKPVTSATTTTTANDGAELSLSGHIDYLQVASDGSPFQIDKNIKANYVFKVFSDPTDRMRPARKTVILTCDIDWKALGVDGNVPCDWSWSSRQLVVATQNSGGTTAYGVADGNANVAAIIPSMKKDGKSYSFVFLYGGGSQLSGLRQGMHIDDVARQIQAEIPGTRVVITGNKKDGLIEYVLLSYGENKVYDVTGDYHYELTNDEPYFTFWTDSKNKLVKWFALKKVR